MMPVATLSPCLMNSGIVSSRDFTALLPTRNETVTTAASISDRPNPAIKCIRSMPRRSARSAYPSALWLSIGMNIPR
ncbi:Uncharacterised protein [Klebsiella pneumoniae]|nr:Uncharacterised protein [Klebsiella pneumoniae]